MPGNASTSRGDDQPVISGACKHCKKNVSGFPGDFARCPACKRMTQLPLEPPRGWRLINDPAKLAVMPFYFVLLFYGSMVAIAWTGGGTGLAGGAIVVVVFAMWIFSITQFSKTAHRQQGWWVPVLLYHVASVIVPICFWLAARGCAPIMQGSVSAGAIVDIAIALAGLFVCLLIYGWARGRLARLRVIRNV